jgi:uncharacterized membrane protein
MDELIDKYRELFLLSKEASVQEVDRIRRSEDKSAKLASLCGLLLAFFGLTGKFVIESFFPPHNIFNWICFILYPSFMIIMAYGLFYLIRALRITNIHINPMSREMIAFFDKNSHIDILYALARNNVKAIEHNSKEYRKKLKNINHGYWAIFLSAVLILIFVLSFVVGTWFC